MVEAGPGAELRAQQAADRLALAFEDIGFDVGRAFPMLGAGADRYGVQVVELGRVSVDVAEVLAAVLGRAAVRGLRVVDGTMH